MPPGAALRAPVLDGDKVTVTLPGPIAQVAAGGGGRFLILHLPQQRKLAVFDTGEAKIVHYVPVTEDNVKFAAGRDKLLVVYPRDGVVQRWSLTTFEREAVTTVAMKVPPIAAAMGSASDGPLCISGVDWPRLGETVFFDVAAMKRIEVPGDATNMFDTSPQMFLRASADGKVFAGQMSPGSHLQSFVWTGRPMTKHGAHGGNWPTPGPDGRVYTTHAVYSAELKQLAVTGVPCVPAHHGPYYLSLGRARFLKPPRPDVPATPIPQGPGATAAPLTLHVANDNRPLAPLAGIDGLDGLPLANPGPLSFDQRIHLLPDARLLIVIPAGNDRLLLHRFDPDQLLEQSGGDYLLVVSQAPAEARKGQVYAYPLVVKSKRGGVTYRLESGPKGMSLAADGRLTWPVPADFAEREVSVIVTVRDGAGQECLHAFSVNVRD